MPDVDVRCSALVFSGTAVLLVRRSRPNDWSLPGGVPGAVEGLEECARRELAEETGLVCRAGRAVLVVDSVNEAVSRRMLDVVFRYPDVDERAACALAPCESGLRPQLVALDQLARIRLRPPIADRIGALHRVRHQVPEIVVEGLRPWEMAVDLGEDPSPEHR
ncbi:NUDIX hydrolase [Kitasatospora sp. NA04385]|uniref:NUDIX domain-containing protein n=1 Tax=Kitasatospora sp. NA04385 TaxID=2742135 RepID=UPI0015910004|nr:NUDIX hydrolase [Kitasatospora sp. NA04385]QKW17837.1 NUDIX hydrolase [Kitasatospora sp. NA04385]